MAPQLGLAGIIAASVATVLAVAVLHVRAMNDLDDENTYTLASVLHPRQVFGDLRSHPQSAGYALAVVLFMTAFRFDSVVTAVVGSVLLVGTALWTSRRPVSTTD